MIAIRKLSWFVLLVLTAALAACGSDDDGGAPPPGGGGGGGGGTAQSVELEQLDGTWLGTFDDEASVRTFGFDIAGGQITNATLDGQPEPGLTASILERADEVGEGPRVFRFEAQVGGFTPRGVLILDPTATYMVYLYSNGQFGVLQKGATEMPADGFAADALAASWEGITVRAPTVTDGDNDPPLSPVEQANSSATCTADTSVDPATTQCDITIADATKTASGLTLDVPELGHWSGTYDGGTGRILLSADSNFAGVWGCTGLPDGFPESCDFSAWTKAADEAPADEQGETPADGEGETPTE